jgi:hypothetical protein
VHGIQPPSLIKHDPNSFIARIQVGMEKILSEFFGSHVCFPSSLLCILLL